jgi:hypothetical protein
LLSVTILIFPSHLGTTHKAAHYVYYAMLVLVLLLFFWENKWSFIQNQIIEEPCSASTLLSIRNEVPPPKLYLPTTIKHSEPNGEPMN